MEALPKIFADFNNADAQGRLRLSTIGSLNDIKEQNITLKPGMMVQLTDYEEFSIPGIVEFSKEENRWVAKINWDDLKSK
jgi:hypothetical protein